MEQIFNQGKKIVPALAAIIETALNRGASDILLSSGVYPTIRVAGKLEAVAGSQPVTNQLMGDLLANLLAERDYRRLLAERELDFSFSHPRARFRANAFFSKGGLCLALRLIPRKIKSFQELGLPPILEKICLHSQGFVLVTGPTGHGKSTTLAAMIEYINQHTTQHIITIEDPIEYEFVNQKSIIVQREVGSDTKSFQRALRSVLREDPNVILVGEMRDLESIQSALTIAETGHLVLSTLHTNSASQTVDRIIDVFPADQQRQVRQQLASVLLGVFSQRLLPRASGRGRIPAIETLIANPAVRSLIREGKVHQLDNVISTSAAEGMISLDKVLAELVSQGEITLDTALSWSLDPNNLKALIY